MNVPDNNCIVQRLWRVQDSAQNLHAEISSLLRKIVVLQCNVEHVDVASVTDRLHETFNAYSFLTRCNGWHDLDDDD